MNSTHERATVCEPSVTILFKSEALADRIHEVLAAPDTQVGTDEVYTLEPIRTSGSD